MLHFSRHLNSHQHQVNFFCTSVRSFGTENRPTERPVAPRDEVYEYIIFRGADIKDIKVCEPPKPLPTLQGGLPNDPAIIQVLVLLIQSVRINRTSEIKIPVNFIDKVFASNFCRYNQGCRSPPFLKHFLAPVYYQRTCSYLSYPYSCRNQYTLYFDCILRF